MKDLLFFDIEVFYKNAFVVFKDINDVTLRVFHNDFTGLAEFIEGKTLVGYNNYFYDDHILHAMLDHKTPTQIKALNDRIIGGEKLQIKNYKFDSLDCFQQIDVGMPSLKKIEANLGKMILESSVSFEIMRELTEEEYLDVLHYCEYDVSMTIQVYKMREQKYFVPKESIVKMLDNPFAKRWNTTTLSANVLLKKPLTKWSNIRIPEELLELVPTDVADMWLTKDKGSVTIHEFDCEIVFGFGGLHGQNMKKKRFENVINLDVASLYPSIIVNHNILGAATEKYKEILEERIRIKYTDPQKQEGLKLILNSVFGLLKSEYSLLCNPKASTTVCGIGQAIIYDLAKRLSPIAEIVQINTDGVAFIPYSDDYKQVWKDWENDYSLTLEEDIFERFYQRDVNNYIAVTPSGKIKTKGGDVNRYHEDAAFKNNNSRIVDICIVNKLVYGRDVLDMLLENLEHPHLFQYILRAGPTYLGTFDNNDNKYERFNRVFAAKDGDFCLFKKRKDLGLVRFADAPMKMYLHNADCSELQDFEKIVDLNHYYQLIMKKLEKWQ
jgi:hypothetical protein